MASRFWGQVCDFVISYSRGRNVPFDFVVLVVFVYFLIWL
jgi:hypothetical protein